MEESQASSYDNLIERYREVVLAGISPEDFYHRVRQNGHSNLDAFVLLEVFFDYNLRDFNRLRANTGQQPRS